MTRLTLEEARAIQIQLIKLWRRSKPLSEAQKAKAHALVETLAEAGYPILLPSQERLREIQAQPEPALPRRRSQRVRHEPRVPLDPPPDKVPAGDPPAKVSSRAPKFRSDADEIGYLVATLIVRAVWEPTGEVRGGVPPGNRRRRAQAAKQK